MSYSKEDVAPELVNGVLVDLSDEQKESVANSWNSPAQPPYTQERANAYPPIGDQLDAILKHVNYRRTQGDELVQDLDDIIAAWLAVKSQYPKP